MLVKTDIGAASEAHQTAFLRKSDIPATDVQEAIEYLRTLITGIGTPAPATVEYVVAASDATLSAERVATDTATIDVDMGTAGQAKWNVVADSIDNTFLANMAQATIKGRASGAGTGDPTDLTATQVKAIQGFATTSTDNAVVRFDGTSGATQNSGVTIDDSNFVGGAAGVGVGGATADTTNRISSNSDAVLFNHAGTSSQVKVNKNATANTASHLFQVGFSGRAEFGLIGSDDFQMKTSPDGAVFTTGLTLLASTGAMRVHVNASPSTSDGAALGTTALMWSDLFLASGGVVNFNNGDVTITHAADTLAFAGAATAYTFSGGPVRPSANDGAALGASATAWSDLFLASGGVINFNAGNYTITHSAGDLAFSGIVTLPNTGLHLLDTNASHDLIIAPGSDLTADRTLTLTTGDSARTLTISGNATISQDYSTAGSPGFTNLALTGYADLTEIASPSNPSANVLRLFAKDVAGTTKLYSRDSAGAETEYGAGGGSITVVLQAFTASGTYTPTSGMKYCIVEQVGGGGGSGGSDGNGVSGQGVAAGGGGGGEYARGVFSAATIGASQAVTIGAGGTAGSDVGGNGGTGGTTSLGALMTTIGGSGGTGTGSNHAATDGPFAGGAGGTGGTGGTFRRPGQPGTRGYLLINGGVLLQVYAGEGGDSFFGFGAKPATVGDATGVAPASTSYGAGAAGAIDNDTTGSAGAAGAGGYMLITEFIT